jgi:hypothetical protein
VPPGEYQLVCWHPNWHIARREREVENTLVNRIVFAPPAEIEHKVLVEPKADREVNFTLSPFTFRAR